MNMKAVGNRFWLIVLFAILIGAFLWSGVGQEDNMQQDVNLNFIIEYIGENGELYNKTYSKKGSFNSLIGLPLSVTDSSGNPISTIYWEAEVSLDWMGSVTDWDKSGSVKYEVDGSTKKSQTLTFGGFTPKKNEWWGFAYGSVGGSTLQSWAGDGSHTLKISVTLSLTAHFSSGASDSKTKTGSASWQFNVESETITSMGVRIV